MLPLSSVNMFGVMSQFASQFIVEPARTTYDCNLHLARVHFSIKKLNANIANCLNYDNFTVSVCNHVCVCLQRIVQLNSCE